MQVLVCLAEAGDLVSKEALMRKVWADTFVTDDVLTRSISELRKALADDPKRPRYIQTVPKGGYRLVQPVMLMEAGNGAASASAPEIPLPGGPVESESPAPRLKELRVRHWWGILLLIVGMGALAAAWLARDGSSNAQSRSTQASSIAVTPAIVRTSVAVLPFKSNGGAGQDDFGIEVSDALTTKLSESTKLAVSLTTMVLRYSDGKMEPAEVGKALNVDYVLSGEIDRQRHNVTVHLVRIRDGVPLLAATLNQKFTDIFQLEDSLCPRIMHDLLVALNHEEVQRLNKRYTENQRAYEAFLKAHYFMNKPGKEDKETSIRHFQKAIELDPKYAMAYAGLADCYMRLVFYGVSPAEFVPKSRKAAMTALELDDSVAYAHSMLGRIAFFYDWDFTRAGREYQRARELQPGFVHQWYASYLLVFNKPEGAEEENRKFSELLPYAPGVGFPQYYFWVRRYDRAAAMLQKMLEHDPGSIQAHLLLGLVFEQQGRSADAFTEFQKADAEPGGESATGALGHLYATTGRRAEALRMMLKLEQASQHQFVSPYSKALIYAGLGQKEEAIEELRRAYAERSLSPPALRCDPRLDSLRGEARFQDFIRTTGLPQ
jgi:tetratricopeptide (TPR) repeat protein